MMSNKEPGKMSDRRLAKLAGERIAAADAARLAELGRQAADEAAERRLAEIGRQAMAEGFEGEAYSLRGALGWLKSWGAAAAVLLLLLAVSSSATALALGQEGLVGCALPEREPDTPALQAALAEYGVERQVAPRFLPEPYEEAEVSVYEDEGLRVFVGCYLDRGLPEQLAEGNRLPLYIVIRQHRRPEGLAAAPRLDLGGAGAKPARRLVVNGLEYYIGESWGVHWLAWRQSGFECVIVGYFSEADAEWLAYLMNAQREK